MDLEISRKKNDPLRDWYAPDELKVPISKFVHFSSESAELRLIRVVSLLHGSMTRMQAWNDDILSIARAEFDLDFEVLTLVARAAAIYEHKQWLEEYSRTQELRGALYKANIDQKAAENTVAFAKLLDRASELVSLYYSVLSLELRIRAEQDYVSLSKDERGGSLTEAGSGGSLRELGEKVDLTNTSYEQSLRLVNGNIARLTSESDGR